MTEISQSQLRQEAVEIALWQMPCPEPDAATMSVLSQFDSGSQDLAVGNSAVSDGSSLPDLGPLKDFNTWESVAATLMCKAESISGFNPASPDFDPTAWNNYLYKLSTMPFFLSYQSRNRVVAQAISALSLKNGLYAATDLVASIVTPQNLNDIVTTIKKMGELAVENKTQEQKNNNQQVGLLSRHGGNLYLGAVRTAVVMKYKESKRGYEQLTQDLTYYCGYGVLDFDKCKRIASTLLDWGRCDVSGWVNGTASASMPPNNSPAWNQ
ncbi:hypothetical protein [Nocardia gipuzkoensis]